MPRTELNGVNLYYELHGHGRPVFVFVHGGMCDHRDWARQVRQLKTKYTVLTLDLRCHGLTKGEFEDCHIERWADDVSALLEVLRLESVVLTGHSLGARIVVEAAARDPERIGALVLLDGSRMYGGLSATEPSSPSSAESAILEALIGPHADSVTRGYLMKNLSGAPPELMQAAVDTIRDWDVGRADTAFAALKKDLPALVIQSTYHDRFTLRYSLESDGQRTPYLDYIRTAMPHALIKTLIGAGHFSMLERSGEVTTLIEEFALAALSRP
jgi:pimeloyl-ACP methyl ester carboxylesterase